MARTRHGEDSDRVVWRGLVAAVSAPPVVYSWDEDRAEIAASLEQLREAIGELRPDHPAVPAMIVAARRIDNWLAHWPARVDRRDQGAGIRGWSEVVEELLHCWETIQPTFFTEDGTWIKIPAS